ncbi:hypothetical protein PLESTB_000205600 [Pleodorina starrii]|uniref:NlpC/P60 domain-containing protein n=1 Tax=Pleodorina starrii TaxID=330485 RepID=A0A9W6BCV9_9CHLO|nr:hypothetical protein PLESTM_000325900 [Pleodorina starrii]GLC49312.1 hypothetical protein PLESTB_000205600 [Pleodorina starrii]GLC73430.1 hypothetical protein PLESTF_001374600 [Pleodorina starrii]
MRTLTNTGFGESDYGALAIKNRAPSLQDAFAEFVHSRRSQASGAGATLGPSKTSPQSRHANPTPQQAAAREERRARLRALFVETARGFIGVPYARKHHDRQYCSCEGCSSSGRQLHHAPLFLDCCGLVRRVARQLQRQLGFRLGPGNQAYQYDTLPVRLASASQLRPGDLVFYSGTYTQPGSRRPVFDMTHVEIFVGGSTGEATIGSRERYKWVMPYDSFRFESSRWKLIAHHFCSIDPWLDGLCVPQSPELWTPRGLTGSSSTRNETQPHGLQQQLQQTQTQVVQQQGSTSSQGACPSWIVGTVRRTGHGTTPSTTWNPDKYSIFGSRVTGGEKEEAW